MSRSGRMTRPMAGDECITFATAHPPDCGGHIDIASAAACATLAPPLIAKPHGLLHLQDPRVLVHLDARQIIRRQHAVLRSPAARSASAAAARRPAQNAAADPGWAALVKGGRRTWRRPAMVLASSYSVRSVILRLTSSMNTSCAPTHRQPSAHNAAGAREARGGRGVGAHDFVEHCEGDLRHAAERQQQGECGERLLACVDSTRIRDDTSCKCVRVLGRGGKERASDRR